MRPNTVTRVPAAIGDKYDDVIRAKPEAPRFELYCRRNRMTGGDSDNSTIRPVIATREFASLPGECCGFAISWGKALNKLRAYIFRLGVRSMFRRTLRGAKPLAAVVTHISYFPNSLMSIGWQNRPPTSTLTFKPATSTCPFGAVVPQRLNCSCSVM